MMSNKKNLILLFTVLFFHGIFVNAQTTPQQMAARMGTGINLGNNLENSNWEQKAEWMDSYFFKDYKEAGFQNVRIPVKWDKHISDSAPYTVDADWMQYVDSIVDLAIGNGLVAVLNTHHENWLMENFYSTDTLNRYLSLWTQIANHFQDKSDNLVFEILNEPYFDMDSLQVDSINRLVLPIIRENNPTRIVMLCGGEAYGDPNGKVLKSLNLPDDDYLIAWIHYYKPAKFTTQETGDVPWGSQDDYDLMTKDFQFVRDWSDSTGVPVYVGEYGTNHVSDWPSRQNWYTHITSLFKEHGLPSAVWNVPPSGSGTSMTTYYQAESFWDKDNLNILTGHQITESQVFSVKDGLWSDRETWDTGIVPGPDDHVLVIHDVYVDTDVEVTRIHVFDVRNSKLLWEPTITKGYTINVSKHFVVEGAVDLNDGNDGFDIELLFSGADTSYLRTPDKWSGTGNEFGPITIQKTGSGIVLLDEGTVGTSDTLDFNSGLFKVMPDAKLLHLNVSANPFKNASDNSHVVGPFARYVNNEEFVYFPVGDGTKYRPVGIVGNDFIDGSSAWIDAELISESADNISTSYADPILDASDVRYWKLTASNTDQGTIEGFAISYGDDDGFNEGDLTASLAYLTTEQDGNNNPNIWYQNPHEVDTVEFISQPSIIEGYNLNTDHILHLSNGESVYVAAAEMEDPPGLPSPGDLLITEVNSHETAKASWAEIYNNAGVEISLEGVDFSHYIEGGVEPNGTISLSGTLDSAQYIIVTRNKDTFENIYGKTADYQMSGLTLNGKTDGLLLEHNTIGVIDKMSVVPAPAPLSPITDDALYLRRDFNADGSDLENHWCEITTKKNGTPGAPNVVTWITSGTNDWHTDANWDDNYQPYECSDVLIPFGGTQPIINLSGGLARNVEVEAGALLTLSPTGELSLSGGLISSATDTLVILESDQTRSSSLILGEKNTSSGKIKYERYLQNDAWYLTSSPVLGETYDLAFFKANFIDKNPEAEQYALLDYNTENNAWNAFPTDESSGVFNSGQGYLMARKETGTTGGIVSFIGELTDNDTSYTVSTVGERWNAVGNPFASAIGITSGTGTNNFIDINSATGLDSSFVAIYHWNDSIEEYIPVNHSSDTAVYAQPGQGFFIKAKTGASQIEFPMTLQRHQPEAGSNSGSRKQQLILSASTENLSSSSTQIKFLENMTEGLDIGYDAGKIKGNSALNLYTQLIADNGIDFAIQCLPILGLKEIEIPIGIDLTEMGSITFSINKIEFPEDLIPVLEDKLLNTKTAFSNPGDIYTATVNENGYGRFYLSFSSTTAVNTFESAQTNFKVWYSNNKIQVSGSAEPNTIVSVYDVNGRLLKQQQLSELQLNQLETGFANAGVYLVRIANNSSVEVHKVSIVK